MTRILGTLAPMSALWSLHPEVAPGTFDCGMIFLDWLAKTNQSAWQLLPLHETHLELGSTITHAPSPYQSYGVGLDPRFLGGDRGEGDGLTFKQFTEKNQDWLQTYALFCALRDKLGTDDWTKWPWDIRRRHALAIEAWCEKLHLEINRYVSLQWHLHVEFYHLRAKAKKLGMKLFGDLPFYLSLKSPLVWENQDLFLINEDGRLPKVSGVPNGPLSHFGRQVWGHPLYRWHDYQKQARILDLWKLRIQYLSQLFDWLRIDHAKGFFTYGSIDLINPQRDALVAGSGATIFTEIINMVRSTDMSVFAEDSGEGVGAIRILLKQLSVPGIHMWRYGLTTFAGEHLLPLYADVPKYPANTVAYTTTHDTETLVGYLKTLTPSQKQQLSHHAEVQYDISDTQLAKRLREAVIDSPARVVIIPIQDWLLIKDRINTPGTEQPADDINWKFKLPMPIEKLRMN